MRLNCELEVQYGKKTGVLLSRIILDILDRFSQSFHCMKALGADDRSGTHFPICERTLSWQSNNVGRINERGLILPALFCTSVRKRFGISLCAH